MKERIGSCKWRVLAGALVVGVVALSVSVDAADRNAARDKGQATARANRLVSGPSLQLDRGATDGGVAAGAVWDLRWLAPQAGVVTTYPAGTSGVGTNDLTLPGAPPAGQGLFLGAFLRDFAGVGTGNVSSVQFTMDAFSGAFTQGLSVWRPSCPGDDDALCQSLLGTGAGSGCNISPIVNDTCAPAFQDLTRADVGDWDLPACNIAANTTWGCGAQNVNSPPVEDPGGGGTYLGTLAVLASDTLVGGPYAVSMIPPDGQTFALDGDGNAMTVKTQSASITVPTGRCCYGNSQCVEDVTQVDCDGRSGTPVFSTDDQLCPANGGPLCAECFSAPGTPNDPDCYDPVLALPDNKCTKATCLAGGVCDRGPIASWNPATQCCNPANGSLAAKTDGNDCTDDSCTNDDVMMSLGTPAHTDSAAGSPCDDGSPCTFACAGSACTDACTAEDCGSGGQDGACDGAGACAGTDVNTIPCASDDDCAALLPGVGCDLGTGFCSCSQFPDLIITPGDSGLPKDPNCYVNGQKVDMTVSYANSLEVINGYQVTILYDPACVDLLSVTPLAPWTQVLVQDIDEAAGEIFIAAGVEFGAGDAPFNNGHGDLFELSFAKIGDCAECQVCWGGINPRDTVLTTNEGQALPPTTDSTCSKPIRTSGDLTLDVPGDVKTNVGCDSVRATVTWDPASASDTCGLQDFVCGGQNESGKDVSDRVVGGGEFPRGATTFCCWAQNDCGFERGFKVGVDPTDSAAIAEGCWTVQVNDQTTLDIEIELSPTMDSKPAEGLTRCIEFEAYSNCVQAPTVFHQDITFGGIWNLTGHYVGEFKSPSGQFKCLTARDKLHTLRACALRSEGFLDCVDGTLYATFKGDPFFAGNWLTGGNLDAWKKSNPLASHDTIDIQDFGQFVAQYLNCYRDGAVVACDDPNGINGDTPCPEGGHPDAGHADINGDGRVDLLDFTFVRMNFLEASKDCCCPGSGGSADTPRTEISVSELRKAGQFDMIAADLNGDGVVNLDDMAAFMAGELPNRKPSHSHVRSSGRK